MVQQVTVTDDGKLMVGDREAIVHLYVRKGDPVDYGFLSALEAAGLVSLKSLRDAFPRWLAKKEQGGDYPFQGGNARMWVEVTKLKLEELHDALEEKEPWHPFFEGPTNPSVFIEGDRLGVQIEVWRAEEPEPEEIRQSLAPYLSRYEASSEITVSPVPEHEGGEGFDVRIHLDRSYPPEATLADAWKFGDEARTLLRVSKGDEIPRSIAVDLLCSGKWDLFYGQPESDWLEAKGEPYDHLIKEGREAPRLELAKDVAALANSPEGGVIVIGLTTNDKGDGDVINGHNEFELSRVNSSAYLTQISQTVYPDVVGIEITRIEGPKEGEGLAVLIVPRQPDSSRPFFVHGFLDGEKVMGKYLLVPIRRGARTVFTDVGLLHAHFSLGRQVIAGEETVG